MVTASVTASAIDSAKSPMSIEKMNEINRMGLYALKCIQENQRQMVLLIKDIAHGKKEIDIHMNFNDFEISQALAPKEDDGLAEQRDKDLEDKK